MLKQYVIFLGLSAVLISACGSLPSSGPSGKNVTTLGRQHKSVVPEVEIVEIDARVVESLYRMHSGQTFSSLGEGYISSDAVDVGDMLEVTIWETAPAVLFGGSLSSVGSGVAQVVRLPDQAVTSQGSVSIPFAGDIRVVGKTPAQIQDLIKERLRLKANQPQVLVRRSQNNAATVSVIRPGNSVRFPLTSVGERVLDAVAAVGGSTSNVQDTNVQLTRGKQVETVALEDLVASPYQNIRLRKGDIVTLITNPNTFTAMGAVGRTQEIGFSVKGLSLAEAVGRMGGLQDYRADARGVFVFRYQPVEVLDVDRQQKWFNKGYSGDAEIPVVYRLNLSDANSLFWMQRFPMKNKDVVYVSNAPLSEVQKFLQFVFSPVTSGVNSLSNLGR